jgi:hypothetical protein
MDEIVLAGCVRRGMVTAAPPYTLELVQTTRDKKRIRVICMGVWSTLANLAFVSSVDILAVPDLQQPALQLSSARKKAGYLFYLGKILKICQYVKSTMRGEFPRDYEYEIRLAPMFFWLHVFAHQNGTQFNRAHQCHIPVYNLQHIGIPDVNARLPGIKTTTLTLRRDRVLYTPKGSFVYIYSDDDRIRVNAVLGSSNEPGYGMIHWVADDQVQPEQIRSDKLTANTHSGTLVNAGKLLLAPMEDADMYLAKHWETFLIKIRDTVHPVDRARLLCTLLDSITKYNLTWTMRNVILDFIQNDVPLTLQPCFQSVRNRALDIPTHGTKRGRTTTTTTKITIKRFKTNFQSQAQIQ